MDNPQTEMSLIATTLNRTIPPMQQNVKITPRKPPPPVKEPDPYQTSFFDLPREVRDMVYDYYWLANPGLIASSTPFHRLILQLRYQGQYEILIGRTGYDRPDNIGEHYPTWLLASKQLLTEALHQFASKAAWFSGDATLERQLYRFRPSAILNTSKIQSMVLYVKNLDYVQNLDYEQDFEAPFGALQTFAHTLGLDQMHGAGIRWLRIVGWSHRLPDDGDFGPRALYIARKILHIFKEVDLQTLELDICIRWPDRWRILYEVFGRGEDMSLVVKKDEKRGFSLRCNIAHRNGRGYWHEGRRRGNNEAE